MWNMRQASEKSFCRMTDEYWNVFSSMAELSYGECQSSECKVPTVMFGGAEVLIWDAFSGSVLDCRLMLLLLWWLISTFTFGQSYTS